MSNKEPKKTQEEIELEEAWKLRMASRDASRDTRRDARGRVKAVDVERVRSQKIFNDLSGVYDKTNFH